MTAHATAFPAAPDACPQVPEHLWPVLNRLRFQAVLCRAQARLDFFTACALIDPAAQVPSDDRMRMLLRVMGQALPSEPIFFRPGETELSFDERWLIAVIDAYARDDRDSLEFLVRRRVDPAKRRLFALLVSGVSDSTVVKAA